jgi:hypothetical protein
MAVSSAEWRGQHSQLPEGVEPITFSDPLLRRLEAARLQSLEKAQTDTPTELATYLTAELARQVKQSPDRIFLPDLASLLEGQEFRELSNLCSSMSTVPDTQTGQPAHGMEQLSQLVSQWLTPERLQSRTTISLQAETLLAADINYASAHIELSLTETGGQLTTLTFHNKRFQNNPNENPSCYIIEEGDRVAVRLKKMNGKEPFPLHLLSALGLPQLADLIAKVAIGDLENPEEAGLTTYTFIRSERELATAELAAVHHQLLHKQSPTNGQVYWHKRDVIANNFRLQDLYEEISRAIKKGTPISEEVLKLWAVLEPVITEKVIAANQQSVNAEGKSGLTGAEMLNIATLLALVTGFTVDIVLLDYAVKSESEAKVLMYILATALFFAMGTLLVNVASENEKAIAKEI